MKGEDGLAWAIETGTIPAQLATTLSNASDEAIADSTSHRRAFGIDWTTITPDCAWTTALMPSAWNT